MTSITSPSSLLPFHSGSKPSEREGKTLPASAAKPLTPEMQAEIAAIVGKSAALEAEGRAAREAFLAEEGSGQANTMTLTNVAQLQDNQILSRISYITELIQSGDAEKYSFHSANGDEQTSSIH